MKNGLKVVFLVAVVTRAFSVDTSVFSDAGIVESFNQYLRIGSWDLFDGQGSDGDYSLSFDFSGSYNLGYQSPAWQVSLNDGLSLRFSMGEEETYLPPGYPEESPVLTGYVGDQFSVECLQLILSTR